MNLDEYQRKARDTAIYLNITNTKILYPALGLIGESGEVAEKIKKLIRDNNWIMTKDRTEAIELELGDCCWYLANICCDTNYSLKMMYQMRNSYLVHKLRDLSITQLTFYLNKHTSRIAAILYDWHYKYKCDPRERIRYINLTRELTYTITCIEEIGKKCGFTLEQICSNNIKKLLTRKLNNKIKGDGDTR